MNKPTNHWNATSYDHNARFVSDLGMPVVSLLAPLPGESILDLGCGDGALTEQLVKLGCDVVGIDPSQSFVTAAVERGVNATLGDARQMQFDSCFDAVFSNAVLHWIPQADVVARNVFRGLKANGRFVGEFGGHGNIAAIMTALQAVLKWHGIATEHRLGWYYPTVAEYRAVLETAGFSVEYIELIPRPTALPTGMIGWIETFRGSYLREKLGNAAPQATQEVEDLLRSALCDQSGNWTADYVRLRFKAIKQMW